MNGSFLCQKNNKRKRPGDECLGQGKEAAGTEPELELEVCPRPDNWIYKIDTDAFQGNEREVIVVSTVRTLLGGTRVSSTNRAGST
jgi:hypothetical protein